jgi:hypothetical protein
MAYEPIEKLERMNEEELMDYVRSRLQGRQSEPMVVWSHGDLPEHFLIDAYALSGDDAFKSRLKRVIKLLLMGWRPGLNDDVMYGSRLIYLTGYLAVEGGDAILSRLATEPALDGLIVYDEPMKNFVLRTLLDFPGQEAKESFWEPLLDDAQYFDTAFFALSLRGAAEGLRYLPQYLAMAFRTGLREGILELRLANFISRHLWPDRLSQLKDVLSRLPQEERERVWALLARAMPQAVERMAAMTKTDVQLASSFDLSHLEPKTRPLELLLQGSNHG